VAVEAAAAAASPGSREGGSGWRRVGFIMAAPRALLTPGETLAIRWTDGSLGLHAADGHDRLEGVPGIYVQQESPFKFTAFQVTTVPVSLLRSTVHITVTR